VLINTAGGLTGGDSVWVEVHAGRGARTTITTPGFERIYRALSGDVVIDQQLHVQAGARLD
jgi:urease accessory protein